MKTKIITTTFLLVTIPVLYFSLTAGLLNRGKTVPAILSDPVNRDKDFINCIFNDIYRNRIPSGDLVENNFGRYKDLNFNAIHRYSGDDTVYGQFQHALTANQIARKRILYDSANDKGLKSIYGSPNSEYFSYGQRLVYEAERGNNGFSYQRLSADIIQDSGRTVLHPCLTNCDASPRFICDSIYENMQHGDGYVENDFKTWYLKPMMRIPLNTPDETPVVKIIILNFEGDTIKQITIKAKNFKQNGIYDGSYVENYSNLPSGEELQVEGGTFTESNKLNTGQNPSEWPSWPLNCKTDFKVYWFGQVDLWFDKMTVDDVIGNALFSGSQDDKIMQEVNAYTSHNANFSFFTDEVVYSQIPCLKYVFDLIKHTNDTAKYWYAISTVRDMVTLKGHAQHFGQSLQLTEVKPDYICSDAHVIYWGVPDNLPTLPGYSSLSFQEYNELLQAHLGDENYHSSNIPQVTGSIGQK